MQKRRCLSAKQIAAQLNALDDSSYSEDSTSSDDDEDNDIPNIATDIRQGEWTFVEEGHDFHEIRNLQFTQESGINLTYDVPSDVNNNIEFFIDLFLDDNLFQLLCDWTNKKAELTFEEYDVSPENNLPASLAKWRPATIIEMKKVIGIMLCMKLNQKPEIRHYWSRNILYKSDFFQSPHCLPRNRFEEVVKFLRFCDYSDLDDNDTSKNSPFSIFCPRKM